jgi:TolB-like protein/Flp pilus assembly protein TadD
MPGAARVYRFGEFTLDVAERQLLREGREVSLRPKAFDTVALLVERHGHLVTKEALLDRVWPQTAVSDAVLTHCVAEVRRALDDPPGRSRWVRTHSRTGYRFVGDVEVVDGPAPGPPGVAPRAPERVGEWAPPATSVAVLPFEDLGPDGGNDAFCDGLSEELINGLTKERRLRVVAHSSSFQFRGRHLDAREIGRLLGVGSIVEGSVRRSGERLRVSAQLIDAADGCHLWAEQYDRRLADVFEIQEELAAAVVRELKGELAAGGAGRPRRRRTPDLEAYGLYLLGRSYWHRRFGGYLEKAIDAFQGAIDRDPLFAEAHSGLADSLSTLGAFAFAPPGSVFPRAAALASRALELDDGLAEAHASLAFVDMCHAWSWPSAGRRLERALDLSPGSALIRLWNGHYLSIVGSLDEAVAEVTRAQALDPLSPVVRANLGWTLMLARDCDRAIGELRRVIDVEPGNGLASFYLGFAFAVAGRHPEALAAFERVLAATPDMPWAAESIGWVRGLMGDRLGALGALREAEERRAARYVPDSAIALLHLGLGQDEQALSWLEKAYAARDALMPWLGRMPGFDRLRTQPRFRAILEGVGLP